MAAAQSGDEPTVSRFTPMALMAYAQLDTIDADARYHAALLEVHTGQVAEGGIDKAAEAGADADGDLLGGASDQGRQGHDRQGRRDEDRDAEAQQLGAQRDGHEDQQPVERRNK